MSLLKQRGPIIIFRKQRGCRDQFLMLVLLGQTEVAKATKGMLVAFIAFSEAYDTVDRGNGCGGAWNSWV